jgi:hypothetical protein
MDETDGGIEEKWPEYVNQGNESLLIELIKLRYQAQLDEKKHNLERQKMDWNNEHTQAQAVNSAYLDTAKGALDRAAAKASFVQGAAVAIGTVYTGILGFSFAAKTGEGTPLPITGIVPALFFGLAIFFATVYSSFMTKVEDVQVRSDNGTLPDKQRQRRNTFIDWISKTVFQRRWALQASVISLGYGVALLPLPYLTTSGAESIAIAGILAGIGILLLLLSKRI